MARRNYELRAEFMPSKRCTNCKKKKKKDKIHRKIKKIKISKKKKNYRIEE